MSSENHFERQLAHAVMHSIETTTPRMHWTRRVPVGKWLATMLAVVFVAGLLVAALAMASNKRAAADEVYPLDVKAVRQ